MCPFKKGHFFGNTKNSTHIFCFIFLRFLLAHLLEVPECNNYLQCDTELMADDDIL